MKKLILILSMAATIAAAQTTNEASVTYNGTNFFAAALGSYRIVTNYSQGAVSVSNSFELIGGARVTQYTWIPSEGVRAGSTQPASFVERGAGGAWEFADNQDKQILANIKVPSDADRSEPVILCVGWDTATTSKTCIWQVVTHVTAVNESVIDESQWATSVVHALSSSTANGLNIKPSSTNTVGATDQCIHATIIRDGNNAADTIGASVYLEGLALKYTKNKLGE